MYTGTKIVYETYEQRVAHLCCIINNDPSKETRDYVANHFDELMEGYNKPIESPKESS